MKYEFIAAGGISMLGIEELRKIVKLFQTFEGKNLAALFQSIFLLRACTTCGEVNSGISGADEETRLKLLPGLPKRLRNLCEAARLFDACWR